MPKSIQQVKAELQNKINKAGEYYNDKIPADLGNHAGVVKVPDKQSMVYVRLTTGQVIEVFNDTAPNIYNWKVYIGRDKSQPALLKVIEVRWVHNIAQTVAYVLFHHNQHEYPAPDTVWIRRDQFLPLLVLPKSGFTVRLFGDMIYRNGMTTPIRVDDEELDMTPYVPATGASYTLLEIDENGDPNFVNGATADSKELLYLEPLPTPTANAFPICVFVLYEGQTAIRRDSTVRDIIDLRMFTSDTPVTSVGTQINTAPAETTIDNGDYMGFWDTTAAALKKISWADLISVISSAMFTYLKPLFDLIYAPITEPIADAHITDTTDAHDASAVSVADAGGYFTGTDVEAVLQEIAASGGGGLPSPFALTNDTTINITANTNNLDPGTYDVLRLNLNNDWTLTGIDAGADGRILILYFLDAIFILTLANQDTGSDAENRFALPGGAPLTLRGNQAVMFQYDATALRWKLVGTPSASMLQGVKIASDLINDIDEGRSIVYRTATQQFEAETIQPIFQRNLTANLTLVDGESLVVAGYIDAGVHDITLEGDAEIIIM